MKAEVTSIENDGFWLLSDQGEFFISFEECLQNQDVSVRQIFNFHEDSLKIAYPQKNLKSIQELNQPG